MNERAAAELEQARAEWRAADRAYRQLAALPAGLSGGGHEQIRQAAARRTAAFLRFSRALDRFTRVVLDGSAAGRARS